MYINYYFLLLYFRISNSTQPVLCNPNGGGSGWSTARSRVNMVEYYNKFHKRVYSSPTAAPSNNGTLVNGTSSASPTLASTVVPTS